MTLLNPDPRQDDRQSEDRPSGDMVWIPGGTFRMGSDHHYPEEAPVHRVTVDGFWIDRTPVTNRQFKAFVKATGHKTFAEIAPDPKDYPGALPHMIYAGSLVFVPPPAVHGSARLEPVVAVHEGRLTGGIPMGRRATSIRRTIILSCMCHSRMRSLTRSGPARTCRPKPNGNLPRVAGSTARSSPGATNSRPVACTWPTPGRASFPGRTGSTTATSEPRR